MSVSVGYSCGQGSLIAENPGFLHFSDKLLAQSYFKDRNATFKLRREYPSYEVDEFIESLSDDGWEIETDKDANLQEGATETDVLTAIESSDEKDARLLQQQLVRLFNMAELRQLSFDLDVDYEIWPDEGKIALARNLVTYFQRRNHLSVLAKKVREERPDS